MAGGVAILYSSSQNSLEELTTWFYASGIPCESQSFIHQVRILSSRGTGWKINSTHWSQSFIHQVRILSGMPTVSIPNDVKKKIRRNPLFIKSEFSHETDMVQHYRREKWKKVAILYSSSQNSLDGKAPYCLG